MVAHSVCSEWLFLEWAAASWKQRPAPLPWVTILGTQGTKSINSLPALHGQTELLVSLL